jgi:hypothetical protein
LLVTLDLKGDFFHYLEPIIPCPNHRFPRTAQAPMPPYLRLYFFIL